MINFFNNKLNYYWKMLNHLLLLNINLFYHLIKILVFWLTFINLLGLSYIKNKINIKSF